MNYDIKKLQKCILEMTIDFDIFCQKHEIVYFLMGGSALGAIRHKGFIPWDDDLDVFMDAENYFKFLEIAEHQLNIEKYYLQKENTEENPLFFTKIRMNGTTYIEESTKYKDIHQGVFIDIMCLNYTYNNRILRYIQYLAARFLNSYALNKRGYITSSSIKKSVMYISALIIREPVKKILLKFIRHKKKESSILIGHFFGRAKFAHTSFPISYLGKSRYISFENHKLPVMEHVESYLEIRYGKNYIEMPNKETRDLYPSHAYLVDCDKDYKLYLKELQANRSSYNLNSK